MCPKDDISTKEDLQRWTHLSDIDITKISDADTGLMIGKDVSQAMEPQEVLHSTEEGGPFALKTKLGRLVLSPER